MGTQKMQEVALTATVRNLGGSGGLWRDSEDASTAGRELLQFNYTLHLKCLTLYLA